MKRCEGVRKEEYEKEQMTVSGKEEEEERKIR